MTNSQGGWPDQNFWNERRVLVTGHTGFKGSWLASWLRGLGAEVLGVALPEAPSDPSMWDQLALQDMAECRTDLLHGGWRTAVEDFAPEIVLHLAAQPLVSTGFAQPARTFEVNVLGTVRLLEIVARLKGVLATLVITTDKVYDTRQPPPYDESHALGGRDPYAASKAAAELVVQGWPSMTSPLATARSGNVIGGGDWAADRLLPDLVRAWGEGSTLTLRRPGAVRPWQHVMEPLRGYLLFAEALANGREVPCALNFGPGDGQAVSVLDLVRCAGREWQRLCLELPDEPWVEMAASVFPETELLTLDSTLAAQQLGWRSLLTWGQAVALSLEWYAGFRAGRLARDLVASQLRSYSAHVRAGT